MVAPMLGWRKLTYRHVVDYFANTNNYPQVPFQHGALVREAKLMGFLVQFVFLDHSDQPLLDSMGKPLGKAVKALSFDSDLEKRFGDHHVIIVS
ncbi:MAG: hypothetical protein R3A44_27265 [Caldilineaceae bacterium]